jgi:tRNA modification GTPase
MRLMFAQQPDTIVARASPPGRADRAIIRVSGPAVPGLIERYISPVPSPRGVTACDITIGSSQWGGCPARRELSCPVLVFCADGPATYTGEDTLEVILPGNTRLVERVIDRLCSDEDVRRAGPGEFSARAYLNGKLSLDRAEGIAAVIASRTAGDLDAAKRLASGETGAVYRAWSKELVTLLALVEAGIDFTDQEDVVPIAPSALHARITHLGREMAARFGGEDAAQSEGSPPLVALLGEPNAGKSTLFNALLGRARSVVAEEVGTTRDVLIEALHLDEAAGPGLAVQLADLPGLETREGATGGAGTRPAVSGAARGRALDALARADAVIHCDPRGEFVSPGQTIPDAVPVLRVRTKADLSGAGGGDVAVCALDGWHLDAVRRGVADIALRAPGGSASVALARHAREIAGAVELLDGIETAIDPAARAIASPELVADGLRGALDQLEQVLGRVTPDEVIGRIFATFCVGK